MEEQSKGGGKAVEGLGGSGCPAPPRFHLDTWAARSCLTVCAASYLDSGQISRVPPQHTPNRQLKPPGRPHWAGAGVGKLWQCGFSGAPLAGPGEALGKQHHTSSAGSRAISLSGALRSQQGRSGGGMGREAGVARIPMESQSVPSIHPTNPASRQYGPGEKGVTTPPKQP